MSVHLNEASDERPVRQRVLTDKGKEYTENSYRTLDRKFTSIITKIDIVTSSQDLYSTSNVELVKVREWVLELNNKLEAAFSNCIDFLSNNEVDNKDNLLSSLKYSYQISKNQANVCLSKLDDTLKDQPLDLKSKLSDRSSRSSQSSGKSSKASILLLKQKMKLESAKARLNFENQEAKLRLEQLSLEEKEAKTLAENVRIKKELELSHTANILYFKYKCEYMICSLL